MFWAYEHIYFVRKQNKCKHNKSIANTKEEITIIYETHRLINAY